MRSPNLDHLVHEVVATGPSRFESFEYRALTTNIAECTVRRNPASNRIGADKFSCLDINQ